MSGAGEIYVKFFPIFLNVIALRYPNFGLRNADAYLLVYDVTNTDSFNFLQLLRYIWKVIKNFKHHRINPPIISLMKIIGIVINFYLTLP